MRCLPSPRLADTRDHPSQLMLSDIVVAHLSANLQSPNPPAAAPLPLLSTAPSRNQPINFQRFLSRLVPGEKFCSLAPTP